MSETFTWQTGDGIIFTLSPGQFMTAAAIPSTVLDLIKQADIAKQIDAASAESVKRVLRQAGYADDGDGQNDRARIVHLACVELASFCGADKKQILE